MSHLHWLFVLAFGLLGILLFTFEFKNNFFYRSWVYLWSSKEKHIKKSDKKGFFVGNSFWIRMLNSLLLALLLNFLIYNTFTSISEKFGYEFMEMWLASTVGLFIGSGALSIIVSLKEIRERGFLVWLKDMLSFSKGKINEAYNDMKEVAIEMEHEEEVESQSTIKTSSEKLLDPIDETAKNLETPKETTEDKLDISNPPTDVDMRQSFREKYNRK